MTFFQNNHAKSNNGALLSSQNSDHHQLEWDPERLRDSQFCNPLSQRVDFPAQSIKAG